MQVQVGKEKPCVFVSHRLFDQATRWEVMQLEIFAFVFCIKKNLAPYLLGKLFTVRTLCTSQILPFPNWSHVWSSLRSSVFKLSTSLELKCGSSWTNKNIQARKMDAKDPVLLQAGFNSAHFSYGRGRCRRYNSWR